MLRVPHKHHMNVRAQPDVERQVPSDVVGVLINHDLVTVPEPVVAEAIVIGGNAKIKASKPEALRAATGQDPNVPGAESPGKMSVLPRMIEVIVGVGAAGIVSNPLAIRMNVRRLRVTGGVAEVSRLFSRR